MNFFGLILGAFMLLVIGARHILTTKKGVSKESREANIMYNGTSPNGR